MVCKINFARRIIGKLLLKFRDSHFLAFGVGAAAVFAEAGDEFLVQATALLVADFSPLMAAVDVAQGAQPLFQPPI